MPPCPVCKGDLADGALIGAAISGGLSSLIFLDNECHTDPACYQAVAIYAGLGAVVGLGIDALIRGHVVVYTARPRVQNRLVVAPIVARGGKGVRLTLSF